MFAISSSGPNCRSALIWSTAGERHSSRIGQSVAMPSVRVSRARVLACLCLLASFGACRQSVTDGPPELGASEGEVRLAVDGDLTSGAIGVVEVHADDPKGVVGGSCLTVSRWESGLGPLPDWLIDAESSRRWNFDDHTERSEYEEALAQCPGTGVSLPTTLQFMVPDLDEGTYRISYSWTIVRSRPPGRPGETFNAEYTLEVASP